MPMSTDGQPEGATLTEVLAGLQEAGYDGSFLLREEGTVLCRSCDSVTAADRMHLDGLRRLEGVSDPADMAAVLAVQCPVCDTRGSIVARYGPEAGPGDAALLLAVHDREAPGLDAAEAASRTEPPPSSPDRR